MPTRRQFIKVGIAGAALFAAARFLDRPLAAPADAYRVLDENAAKIVRALIPVVLAGSLPSDDDSEPWIWRWFAGWWASVRWEWDSGTKQNETT